MARPKIDVQNWSELAQKAQFSVANLVRLMNRSARQLRRDFQAWFGKSPQAWLDEQRITAAQARLLSGQSLKQVAAELGFKQNSHFCRKFKAGTNLTPSEFLRGDVPTTNGRDG